VSGCAAAINARLAAAGGWLGRPEMDHGLGCTTHQIDDELADLVAAGTVLYNERSRQYRLAGTPLALSALKRLVAGGADKQISIVGRPSSDRRSFQVGIARRVPAAGGAEQLVMCEVALDNPKGFEATLQLGAGLLALADQHGAAAEVAAAEVAAA
jgi:hypothetical protein